MTVHGIKNSYLANFKLHIQYLIKFGSIIAKYENIIIPYPVDILEHL